MAIGACAGLRNRAAGEVRARCQNALIGFCGAPWTVATYMIAGEGTPDQAPARMFAYRDPQGFAQLIDRLVAGLDRLSRRPVARPAPMCVQIFDTWAGVLPPERVRALVHRADRRKSSMACAHRSRTRGSSAFRAAPAASLRAISAKPAWTRVGLDWRSTSITRAKSRTLRPVQGNVDPLALLAGGEALDREVDDGDGERWPAAR